MDLQCRPVVYTFDGDGAPEETDRRYLTVLGNRPRSDTTAHAVKSMRSQEESCALGQWCQTPVCPVDVGRFPKTVKHLQTGDFRT